MASTLEGISYSDLDVHDHAGRFVVFSRGALKMRLLLGLEEIFYLDIVSHDL